MGHPNEREGGPVWIGDRWSETPTEERLGRTSERLARDLEATKAVVSRYQQLELQLYGRIRDLETQLEGMTAALDLAMQQRHEAQTRVLEMISAQQDRPV